MYNRNRPNLAELLTAYNTMRLREMAEDKELQERTHNPDAHYPRFPEIAWFAAVKASLWPERGYWANLWRALTH